MSVIGDFTVPANAFALSEALSAVPEMTVRADQLATHSTMEVLPFLWASGGELDTFTDAVKDDSTVEEVSVVDELEDTLLYKVEWEDEFVALVDDMADHHAAVIDARGRDEDWRLRLRFVEDSQVSSFQRHFDETGHPFEVQRLYHPSEARQRGFGLTAEQHETLSVALREGYFEVPRGTSVAELGELLGVSSNAVSQRLRRGCDSLLRSTLAIEDG